MPVTSAVQREGVIPQSHSRGLLSSKLRREKYSQLNNKHEMLVSVLWAYSHRGKCSTSSTRPRCFFTSEASCRETMPSDSKMLSLSQLPQGRTCFIT